MNASKVEVERAGGAHHLLAGAVDGPAALFEGSQGLCRPTRGEIVENGSDGREAIASGAEERDDLDALHLLLVVVAAAGRAVTERPQEPLFLPEPQR